jgi:hypothetical protein
MVDLDLSGDAAKKDPLVGVRGRALALPPFPPLPLAAPYTLELLDADA